MTRVQNRRYARRQRHIVDELRHEVRFARLYEVSFDAWRRNFITISDISFFLLFKLYKASVLGKLENSRATFVFFTLSLIKQHLDYGNPVRKKKPFSLSFQQDFDFSH